MKMTLYYGILIVVLLVVSVQSTSFKRCNRGVAPLNLHVYDCNQPPCNVYRGRNVTAVVQLRMPQFAPVLVPKVNALVDLWLTTYTKNIPFGQRDACSTLTRGHCPVRRGEIIEYYFTMPVSPTETRVSCDIEVSLQDTVGNTLACLLLPVVIQ